jgi:hypothetical protein
VTTNAGFRKENDEKRQEEKKEKHSWQWLNRPARSGYIRSVGIKRAISISLGTILEKRVRAPKRETAANVSAYHEGDDEGWR